MESLEKQQHALRSTPASETEESQAVEQPRLSEDELRTHAKHLIDGWEIALPESGNAGLSIRISALSKKLDRLLLQAQASESISSSRPSLEFVKARRMLAAVIVATETSLKAFDELPHIHVPQEGVLPRIVSLADYYIRAVNGAWSPDSLSTYLNLVQQRQRLLLDEILLLPQAIKFAQLQFIVACVEHAPLPSAPGHDSPSPLSTALRSLRRLNEYDWRSMLEAAVPFEPVLRRDPAGTYPAMEDETRDSYRRRVAHLARRSDFNEFETATAAIEMAIDAQTKSTPDPRLQQRIQHVGFYLFAEGLPALERRIGYHPTQSERITRLIRRHNDDFYIVGIMLVSMLLIVPIIAPQVPRHAFWLVMLTLLLALLPVTQGAVDLVNNIVSSLLKATALPKIDCTESVPAESTTVVVVPTLLLHERQVQELFEDLEARYLANEDPNIHFALLTDLPDSPTQPGPDEHSPLVQMAVRWTENLNSKYANGKGGAFLLLHRHRVFNTRQGVWMGWERKRGKLLDLNKLLLHDFDSFPVKAGPLHVLERVRYVITLDSDTKLPHATAARMIGTISHPLNRAIIDPTLRIVTQGYGILQPRVGVSVASASRSRLAAIYSGETGFDIYTRAVSDVYQDLFGEGIFTGKGIYEVSVLHHVLERRFPRNSLLSHDLIEGAYVRAGLVTDVEIIDDYPSQYHAHNRRKHRWIRGDWQILRWLVSPVPDESGRLVQNPISLISQWKIFDNLRRSLVEPITFLVLVLGWFFLPGGARYWTLITFILLTLPALVQFAFDLCKAVVNASAIAATGAFATLASSVAVALLNLTFLAHQMMLSLDAIVRSLTRTLVSGRRLLEWETAAQSEQTTRRNSIDVYLQLSPLLAALIAAGLAALHPRALYAAGPILLLWLTAPLVALWLNSPPRGAREALSTADRTFLESHVVRIWRFYAEFAGPQNHWLVPDNVEEKNLHPTRMLTPTNIGLLLNARQAAVEFGLLMPPEFTEATLGSLNTYNRLQKERGHIFNWYDLESLRPIPPVVVSTVDSGNLAASFYTLHTGAVDLLKRPLLSIRSFDAIESMDAAIRNGKRVTQDLTQKIAELYRSTSPSSQSVAGSSDAWLPAELSSRRAKLADYIEAYLPWLLPAYVPLAGKIQHLDTPVPSAESAETYIQELSRHLSALEDASPLHPLAAQLLALLPTALDRLRQLRSDLETIAALAEQFVEEMDFAFLFNPSRLLLSNGFDAASRQLHTPCFDMLASEARMAAFLAVAKGDIPQQSWFHLDRSHVLVKGRAALLSWTATMFEYLMPTLWMRSYPETLLTNSLDAVVQAQIDHVKHIPWGISESGYADLDDNGRYLYQAWGIPALALKYRAEDGPVISPYSTFLALPLRRRQAIANLRRMESLGWLGEYGLYEAADYTEADPRHPEPRLVRSWMAHHQGMALLALTNVLRQNVFQTWFHANPRVRATEQLLHEKTLSRETLNELSTRTSLAPNDEQHQPVEESIL